MTNGHYIFELVEANKVYQGLNTLGKPAHPPPLLLIKITIASIIYHMGIN